MSPARIDELVRIEHELCRPMVPFDGGTGNDAAEPTPAEVVPDTVHPGPEDGAIAGRLAVHARAALRTLAPREREILRLRYGFDLAPEQTLQEIGQHMGLTRQRILQIASGALAKLRTSDQACHLRTFWD